MFINICVLIFKRLKEHQRSGSGNSRLVPPHSPATGGRIRPTKETPTKRGSKRRYMYSNLMKKASLAKHAIYSLSADPGECWHILLVTSTRLVANGANLRVLFF